MKYFTVIISAVCLLLSHSHSSIIYVPSEEPTIQAGIDAAVDGDTVLVAAGTYTGSGNRDIDFSGKLITVMSEHGADETIIDCEGNISDLHRGFIFQSSEDNRSILNGFTIQKGYENRGGAIYCNAASPAITGCHISDNTASTGGGGVYCVSSSPVFRSCIIAGNRANTEYGGGIYFHSKSSPALYECSVSGNTACWGGGIFCWDAIPTIENCVISDNSTNHAGGGGIYLKNSSPDIINTIITGNDAFSNGGAIVCNTYSDARITNCTISRNTAQENAGALFCYSQSSPVVTNSILWGDSPEEIYVQSGHPSISYSDVQGGWSGTGNIDTDPLFVDPLNDDFHLQNFSPVIDRGTDNGTPELDFEGDQRLDHPEMPNNPSIWDMGADEFNNNSPPEDFSLLEPVDGDYVEITPVFFDWEDTVDPDTGDVIYKHIYDSDPDFPDPTVSDTLFESEYTLDRELDNFSTYYWKVAAYDDEGGITASRETFSFFTYFPEAILDVSPDLFDFTLFINETATDYLYISNPGNIDLEYVIEWNHGWLDAFPFEGIVHPDMEEIIEISCFAAGLKAGTYHDTLTIETNAKEQPVCEIPVTLTVESPILTILECDYPTAPRGGYLQFTAGLANTTQNYITVDAWLDLYIIGSKPYKGNPLAGPATFVIGPFYEGYQRRKLYVPYYAPLGGPYTLFLRCGQYPEVWYESFIEFSIVPRMR
jgi:parallel beta-helix repeat protein